MLLVDSFWNRTNVCSCVNLKRYLCSLNCQHNLPDVFLGSFDHSKKGGLVGRDFSYCLGAVANLSEKPRFLALAVGFLLCRTIILYVRLSPPQGKHFLGEHFAGFFYCSQLACGRWRRGHSNKAIFRVEISVLLLYLLRLPCNCGCLLQGQLRIEFLLVRHLSVSDAHLSVSDHSLMQVVKMEVQLERRV